MKTATCFTIILIVVLVGLALPGNSPARTPGAIGAEAPAATGGWQITTFHSQTVQGTYSSLALDQEGNPHISFLDETSYDVKYVRWDGDNWEERTVDTLTFLAWSNTSLALNGDGQPQIAYPYANPCKIGHAQWDGTQWQLVKLNTGCLFYATLALDGTGEPCLSYNKFSLELQHHIMLTCHEAAGWQTASLVDTMHYSLQQELALYHSLVLQSDGTPHLSYYRQIPLSDPAQLWYATRSGGSWVRTVVDEGSAGVGSYSSLALDSQNRPRISYYDHTNGDLKYAKWSGSQWYTETVDSSGDVGSYTSLDLDGSGNPHISYYDATNHDLKYAYWNGGQWHVETVDSSGDVGEWTSLMLNAAGNAHISYYDHTNGDLKYATNNVIATGILEGTVDLQGRADESGAEVCAWQGGAVVDCTTTDAAGYYLIELLEGTYDVTVEMARYLDAEKADVSVVAGDTTTLTEVKLLGGDCQDDCIINILDLSFMGYRFGSCVGDPLYDPRADINNDGCINILDITGGGVNFNKTCPVPWP